MAKPKGTGSMKQRRIAAQTASAQYDLARQFCAQGDLDQAMACVRRVLAVNPNHRGAIDVREEIESEYCQSAEYFKAEFLKRPRDPALFRAYANYLHRTHRYAESIGEYQKSIELDSTDALAFHQIGRVYAAIGGVEKAKESFRKALALRPDLIDSEYFIAGLEGGGMEYDSAKSKYVTRLFDLAANTFDRHLVDNLHCRIPELVRAAADEAYSTEPGNLDVLDLGCGTGLSGVPFKKFAKTLTGVDLSPGMLSKARERNIYDELVQGSLIEFMRSRPAAYDLVLAADVFVYVGPLEAVFSAVAAALRNGGRFAFSVETIASQACMMRGSGRYAHSLAYISGLAQQNGFTVQVQREGELRQEAGTNIKGVVFVLAASRT